MKKSNEMKFRNLEANRDDPEVAKQPNRDKLVISEQGAFVNEKKTRSRSVSVTPGHPV